MSSCLLKKCWQFFKYNCSVTQTHALKFYHMSVHLPPFPTHPPPQARWHLFVFHRVVMTFVYISESDAKNEKI